ncbi:YfhO family protein [Roseivirga pacifica]|uniref:YfhO family protein n=1 Tax=Roseivirga pacifica TaxID=1267423 RepID=UPI003BAEFC1D
MKPIQFKKDVLPHLVAIVVFLAITVLFFQPIFFGNQSLSQGDITQWKASAQELIEYREQTGEEGLWTNSIFGGMPAYLISVKWGNELIKTTHAIFALGLPHPVRIVFVAMLSFYIMLLCFKVRPYVALIGAVAFGLSSYNIIGLTAGHNARISAVSFMPLVMGGIHLCLNRNKLLGFSLTALALAMQLRVNHLQITYYLAFIIGIYLILQAIHAYKSNELKPFATKAAMLALAGILAVGTFFGEFYATYEYGKYSNRGASELSQQVDDEMNADGLSPTYAFQYSNGTWDPFTLFIPNALGGNGPFPANKALAEALTRSQVTGAQQQQYLRGIPTYWGKESATTYYAGAIMVFLFVVGILFVEKRYVIWLVAVAVLGIILSYGRNMAWFNNLMFDYFPGYNKFRSVTFTIVMPIFSIALLGSLGLEKLLQTKLDKATQKKLYIALGSTAGLALLLAIGAGMFSFRSGFDAQLPETLIDAIRSDRKYIFRMDALRAFAFIAAFAIMLWLYLNDKVSKFVGLTILVVIGLADVLLVSSRFISDANYVNQSRAQNYVASQADQYILANKTEGDRVADLTRQFYDAQSSYFHHLISGYHGARVRRYQELIDNAILPEVQAATQQIQQGQRQLASIPILNMLNTKFFIINPNSPQGALVNNGANGSAWFVNDLVFVNDADGEFNETQKLTDTKNTAVVNSNEVPESTATSANGTITLTDYHPGYWKYESNNSEAGFAVFSEVHYPKGFEVTIDGEPVEMKRANYILRALEIPAGNHTIEFNFAPKIYTTGTVVMRIMSILVLLSFLGSVYLSLRKKD